MFSSTHLIILAGCVFIFALRAYNKGIWLSIIGFVGFVCAYIASAIATAPLVELTKDKGLEGIIAMLVTLIALFFTVSALISYVAILIFPSLKKATSKQRLLGAVLGATTGAIIAVGLIWLISVLSAFSSSDKTKYAESDPLGKFSSMFVAELVRAGMNFSSDDEFRTNIVATAISEPQEFSAAIKEVSSTQELKSFWRDQGTQQLMMHNNIDELIDNPNFLALVEQPAMKRILEKSLPKDAAPRDNHRYVASQMSFVWRRMDTLRSDERVIEILNDAEVMALVEKQNTVALLANKKVQTLITIVMEEGGPSSPDGANSAHTVASEPIEPVPLGQSVLEHKTKVIYKWQDEKGNTRYTDWSNTPQDKRETAQKVVQ
ncbi:CvpA family protein [Agarilytica rhodophyticola]|uniref:CvpA family protein n=1 Tax=Agarilytica rhodophyticola TaxID=1737490 RepID=UPI000B342F6F|nr:CvpA family protein [Agarilytica rhodophyticola]